MTTSGVLDMPVDEVRAVLDIGYAFVPDNVAVVSGEIATVCRVTCAGRSFAFKAMPASGRDAALIHWQTAAMLRLAKRGLPVPTVEPDRQGRSMFEYRSAGRDVLVLLTDWLTDPPLSDVTVDAKLLHVVGETAARVNQALDGLEPPVVAGHAWELVRTADAIRGALDHVHDARTTTLATRALEVFDGCLAPLLPKMPWSVVHHDLHDSNLLVGLGADGAPSITGVLDFGDMVRGPRLAELAVAAAYAARNTDDPRAALIEVATGWSTITRLTPAEVNGLLPAAVSRLATNLVLWAARGTGPRATYAASRATGTEDALRELLDVDPHVFAEALREAVRT